ncbi:MAG: FtsW/RodA/SpoVE family cell cycle protein [Acidimicrobiia bacterium]
MSGVVVDPGRRSREAALLLLAGLVTAAGSALVLLAETNSPALEGILVPALTVGVTALGCHLAIRRLAPQAMGFLLPLAVLLNGMGIVMIARLDRDLSRLQVAWTLVGLVAFVVVLAASRRIRDLERFRYTFALAGIAALLLPVLPGIGREINGARLWVRLGPLNFQPGEAAKVFLVVFLAAYLVEKRELLAVATRRLGPLRLPDPRHLGPMLLAWGFSIVVMVQEKDLGSSLLFFAVFAAMVYMATGRASYLLVGGALFAAGAVAAYTLFGHVQARVVTWIDPWAEASGRGFQLVQALFAFGSGGLTGSGLGLGYPGKIPNASTDFVFAALGEELGLAGTCAVLAAYVLLVGGGFAVALRSEQPFAKLLAAGLATILGIQTFIILGGTTRLIPLTGITLPFMSYGGSSLVANYAILALLLRVSDDGSRHRVSDPSLVATGEMGPLPETGRNR